MSRGTAVASGSILAPASLLLNLDDSGSIRSCLDDRKVSSKLVKTPEREIHQLTEDQRLGRGGVRLHFTKTFDMNLLGLAELATVHTLRHWTTFLFDLEEGPGFMRTA